MAVALTLASRLAALRCEKRSRLTSVRVKAWATLTPAISSWMSDETSPIDSRVLRKARRADVANNCVMINSTGTSKKLAIDKRQSSNTMAMTIPTKVNKLPIIITNPWPSNWVMTSISLTMRDIKSPAGFLSKKRNDNFCKWPNNSLRICAMVRCPTCPM